MRTLIALLVLLAPAACPGQVAPAPVPIAAAPPAPALSAADSAALNTYLAQLAPAVGHRVGPTPALQAAFAAGRAADPTLGVAAAIQRGTPSRTGLVVPVDLKLRAIARSLRAPLRATPMLADPSAPAFDWTTRGVVSPIQDQQQCGDCWAFAVTACAESANAVAGNPLLKLAEEDVLSRSGGGSCNGGWWPGDWVVQSGIAAGSALPYVAQQESYDASSLGPLTRAAAWGYVDPEGGTPSVGALKAALCQYGPIMVGINADNAFMAYAGGVFGSYQSDPANPSIDHAVVVVGWSDADGAWKVRNHWTTSWGEAGYVRVRYGYNDVGYGAAWFQGIAAAPAPQPAPTPTPTPQPQPQPAPTPTPGPGTTYTITINGTVSIAPADPGDAPPPPAIRPTPQAPPAAAATTARSVTVVAAAASPATGPDLANALVPRGIRYDLVPPAGLPPVRSFRDRGGRPDGEILPPPYFLVRGVDAAGRAVTVYAGAVPAGTAAGNAAFAQFVND